MAIMKMIDPHVHFWNLSLGYYPWLTQDHIDFLGDIRPLQHNYLPINYLDDSAGFEVEKVVHIEAVATRFAKDEVNWMHGLAEHNSIIGGMVAAVDLLDVNNTELLSYYANMPLVKGVRQIVNWHQNSRYRSVEQHDILTNPAWVKHYDLLKQYNLSFDMQICPMQLAEAYQLACHYPDVIMIIGHAGLPIADELACWRSGIAKLASCPNVMIKLSGFGMLDHQWTVDSIKDCMNYIVDQFGTDRCMVASNFPVDRLYQQFSTLIKRYDAILASLSAVEKEKLFYANAKRIYQIK